MRFLPLLLVAAACTAPQPDPSGMGGGGGGFGGGGPFAEGGGTGCFSFGADAGVAGELDVPLVPATPPPPVSGGTLAVLADGTLVVADPDRDRVTLVSPTNAVRHVALQPGDEPGRATAGPSGRAFVALRRGGAVVELDVAKGTLAARHAVCSAPRGLAWSPARQTLAVACATGELVELHFTHGAVDGTATTTPAPDLRDVFEVDGALVLSSFRDARLYRRRADGAVAAQPAPPRIRVLGFDVPEPEPDAGFDGGTADVFAPHVAWRTVPGLFSTLMVHQRMQTTPIRFFGCGAGYGGTQGNGIVHTAVTRLTDKGTEQVALLRAAVLPVDLAVSENEERLALAANGVWLKRGGFDFERLALDDGEFTSVAFRGQTLVAFDRVSDTLTFVAPDQVRTTLALDAAPRDVRSTGHRLFHRATAAQLACASCHPEGGEDGNVWQLPEGPRRTPSLRGGLEGTEPFHWAGDLPSMDALMSEVMVRRMGGVMQSPARTAALLDWVDAQPKLGAPPGLDPASVDRGRTLFNAPELGCASCHPGALGTNNANAVVGTGVSLQVPRLVELAYRAPLFHDGRVPTLEARFTAAGGGDAHGHVSQLTAAQLRDLVEYLKSR